jgi:hypothetical protein
MQRGEKHSIVVIALKVHNNSYYDIKTRIVFEKGEFHQIYFWISKGLHPQNESIVLF